MKCPKCKTQNDDDALICKQCSFKLKTKCPACGSFNPIGARVCTNCQELLLKNCPVCDALNVASATACRKCATEFETTYQTKIKKVVTGANLTVELINIGGMKNNFASKDELLQKLLNKFYQLFSKAVKAENQKPLKINEGVLTCEFKGYTALFDSAHRAIKTYIELMKKFDDINYALDSKLHFSYKLRWALTTKRPTQKEDILKILSMGVVEDLIVTSDIVDLLNQNANYSFELIDSGNENKIFKYIDKEKIALQQKDIEEEEQTITRNFIFKDIIRVMDELKTGYIYAINGENGLGKSNIINSIRLALAQEKNIFWIMGQCPLYCENTTFGFFKDLLRNLFDLPNTNIDIEASKDRVRTALTDNIKITDTKVINDTLNIIFPDDERTQKQIFENKRDAYIAISTIFKALLQNKKLILQIEDLEKIDGLSYDFLRELFTDGILDCNITVLISSNINTSLADFFKVDNINNTNSSLIQLSPLNKEEIDEFLQNPLKNKDVLGENLLNQIYTNSKGYPIFIEEFLYALLQMGAIKYGENNNDEITITRDALNTQMPKNATDIIKLRLTHISQANTTAFKTLYYASLLGFKFVPAILKNILNLENDAFGQILTYLSNHNFIEAFDSFNYVFKNRVLWETVRNLDLDEDNKKSGLMLTTDALCKLSIPDMPVVIKNYREALLPAQELLRFIEYAAKEAYVIGDDKAYVYYKDLLIETLKDTQIENKENFIIAIKEELGTLLYNINPEKAITYLSEILDYYESQDVTKALKILDLLSIAFENTGNYIVALECIDKAIEKTNERENPLAYAILIYSKLEDILNLGRYEELNNFAKNLVLPTLNNRSELLLNEPSTLSEDEFKYIEFDTRYLLGFSMALQGIKDCIPVLEQLNKDALEYNFIDFSVKARLAICAYRALQCNTKEIQTILGETKDLIPSTVDVPRNTFMWYLLKNIAQFFEGNRDNVKTELNMLANFAINVKQFTFAPVIKSLLAKMMLEEGDAEATQNTCYQLYCEAANNQWVLSALSNWYICMDAYLYKEEYTSAIKVGEKAMDIAVKANIVSRYFAALFNAKIAECYISSDDIDMAKIYMEQAEQIAIEQEYYFLLTHIALLKEQLLIKEIQKNPNLKIQNIQEIYKNLCNAEKMTEITQNHNMSIQVQEHLKNITKFAQDQGLKLI